jgi:hypothetical protein
MSFRTWMARIKLKGYGAGSRCNERSTVDQFGFAEITLIPRPGYIK